MIGQRPLKTAAFLLVLCSALLLAGCRTSQPPADEGYVVSGRVEQQPGFPILGVSLFLIDPSYYPGDIYLHDQGSWVSSMAAVKDDSYDLPLPEEEEFPPELLVAAAEGVQNVNETMDCDLEVSADSAMVTLMSYSFTAIPSLWAYFPNTAPGFASADSNRLDGLGQPIALSWTYATEDVSLQTVGTGCSTLIVELELSQGWNQVGWGYEPDQRVLALRNAEGDTVTTAPVPN